MTWTGWSLAQVATLASLIVVAVTVIIYYGQLRAMNRARQLDSLLAIMKYTDDFELRRARYFMLEHGNKLQSLFEVQFSLEVRQLIDAKIQELSLSTLTIESIDRTLNVLNNVCYLIRYGHAPAGVADTFLRNSLLRFWDAFEPYVKHRRTRPDEIVGQPSRYAAHLEWVVNKRCRSKGKYSRQRDDDDI